VEDNLRTLGLERLALVTLRLMPDSGVPFADSLGAVLAARDEVLAQGDHVLLIPGTSSVAHLRENLGAADVVLDTEDLAALDRD
jgi:hypothetical protein